ncbi:MAG: hypothetical protein IKD76_00695 [Clostridia bacterium]|nr:hypothetical protein [Clostridia bacterium]
MKFKKYLVISILIVMCIFDVNIIGNKALATQDELTETGNNKVETTKNSELANTTNESENSENNQSNANNETSEKQETTDSNNKTTDEGITNGEENTATEESTQPSNPQANVSTTRGITENTNAEIQANNAIGETIETQTNNAVEDTSETKTFVDQENEDYYYAQEEGTIQTGWFESDGETYYADENGQIVSGFRTIEGNTYYFNPYLIRSQFIKVDGYDYYVNENGVMQTGWFQATGFIGITEAVCYANNEGIVQKGLCTIAENTYYLSPYIHRNEFMYLSEYSENIYVDNNGVVQTGLFDVDGRTYCTTEDGYLLYGLVTIDGNKYYFDDYMIKNDFRDIYNEDVCEYYRYYFDENGIMQESNWLYSTNDKVYYKDENGNMASGLVEIDGKTYYFDQYENYMYMNTTLELNENGELPENPDEEVVYSYYFGEDGSLQTGIFTTIYDSVYYADESGKLEFGFKYVNGNKYYFNYSMYKDEFFSVENDGNVDEYYADENGVIKTSWFEKDEYRYYAYEDGKLAKGSVNIDGKKYHFEDNDYYLNVETWIELDGKRYYYNEDGILQTGIFTSYDGESYYADNNGVIKTGLQTIAVLEDRKTYYFNPEEDGHMLKNSFLDTNNDGKYEYYFDENGVRVTGFFEVEGGTYYANANGEIMYGLNIIDGKKYYFNPCMCEDMYIETEEGGTHPAYYVNGLGEVATGWISANSSYISCIDYNGGVYYKWCNEENEYDHDSIFYANDDGVILKEFQRIGGDLYYFDANYYIPLLCKSHIIDIEDNEYYYVDDQGKVLTGFFKSNDGYMYYATDDGKIINGNGVIEIDGKYYYSNPEIHTNEFINGSYFDQNGERKTGWFTYNNDTYYSNSDGCIIQGLCKINEHEYYLNPYMAIDEWLYVDEYNCYCYFNENGILVVKDTEGTHDVDDYRGELVEIDGSTYYFDINGVMQTGWFNKGKYTYYADNEGRLVEGYKNIDGNTYYFYSNYSEIPHRMMKNEWKYTYDEDEYSLEYAQYFNEDGILQTGWFEADGETYYADEDGKAVEGIRTIEGNTYYFYSSYNMCKASFEDDYGKYFDADGVMQTGWFEVGNNKFYADNDGNLARGKTTIGGNTYYFDEYEEPYMYRDIMQDINGNTYYFNENGIMQTNCIIEYNGDKYYANENGEIVSGIAKVDGNLHYFTPWMHTDEFFTLEEENQEDVASRQYYADENGIVQTGWFEVNGSRYYADAEGKIAEGIILVDGKKYYLTPSLNTNVFTSYAENDIYRYEYYFDENGEMKIGWFEYDGETYYAKPDGKIAYGVQEISGDKYYFNNSDEYNNNPAMCKNFWYGDMYFGSDGKMQKGFFNNEDGETYYANSNGIVQYGLVTVEGNTYYFDYAMRKDEFIYDEEDYYEENPKYYFNADGIMQTGWFNVGDEIYYAYENGIIAKGLITINGKTYYFDNSLYRNSLFLYEDDEYYAGEDGAILTGVVIQGDRVYCFDETGKRIYTATEDEIKNYSRLIKINNKFYYANTYGEIVKDNWVYDNNNCYYASPITGELYTGFNYIDGIQYYFNENGERQVGKIDIGNQSYYFDTDEYEFAKGRFITIDGKIYYFGSVTGMLQKIGWYTSEYDEKYYMDTETGEVYTGLNKVEADYYYFNENGVMQTGDITIDGQIYRFNTNGTLKLGKVTINGNTYYFKNDATVAKGEFIKIGSNIYYFGKKSGTLQKTGWYTKDGNQYYLNTSTGVVAVGLKTISGNQYYFDTNGVMAKGEFIKVNGKLYYFGANTGKLQKSGWYEKDNNKYYLGQTTGEVAVGLKEIEGIIYYFNEVGQLVKDELITLDGDQYYFDENGEMVKGRFIKINGNLYYFGKDTGTLKKSGWFSKDGKQYYINTKTGIVAVGLKTISGEKYYFNENGVMAKGEFINIDGKLYYFGANTGKLQKTGWFTKYGNHCYFDLTTGEVAVGVKEINGTTYYFNEAGQLVKNEVVSIDGNQYYTDENGVLQQSTQLHGFMVNQDKLYYYESGQKQTTGWFEQDGNKYYLDPITGEVAVGLKDIDNKIYYFSETGVLEEDAELCGVVKIGNTSYLLDKDGNKIENKCVLIYESDGTIYHRAFYDNNGVWCEKRFNIQYEENSLINRVPEGYYYFNENGVMQTGDCEINGEIYHFNNDGTFHIGLIERDGKTYCQCVYLGKISLAKGFYAPSNPETTYYFDITDGSMQKIGWVVEDEKTYYVDEETGIMAIGLKEINDDFYYFTFRGDMASNTIVRIDDSNYYFDEDGKMAKGRFIIYNDEMYYTDATNGKILTGWFELDGKKYYAEAGKICRDGKKLITECESYIDSEGVEHITVYNQAYYFFEDDGVMQTGFVYKYGQTFYCYEDGRMAINESVTINGKTYTFDSDGVLRGVN